MGKRNRDKLLGTFPERLSHAQMRGRKSKHIAKAVNDCNWEELIKMRPLTDEETNAISQKHLERFKREEEEIQREAKRLGNKGA